MKLGQVTITVEPHVFEATMYAVKDPKPPAPLPVPNPLPTLQYGPPNGVMPPPPTPVLGDGHVSVTSSPVPATSQPTVNEQKISNDERTLTSPAQQTLPPPPQLPPPQAQTHPTEESPRPSAAPAAPSGGPVSATATPILTQVRPVASPRGMESMLSPSTATPQMAQRPPQVTPAPAPSRNTHTPSPALSNAIPAPPALAGGPARPNPVSRPVPNGAPPAPAKGPAPGTDPIILTLAEKAGEDEQLRDLMKKVAQGDAAKHELEKFQAIIDQITAESKRKGAVQGPSADRLLVEGRTVRYFADEVRAILDIVLLSNPKQTSADLRPPAGSDPLVVLLVKTALDDAKTKDMVRRIAENRPQFSDATDLKAVLDRLKNKLAKDRERQLTRSPLPGAGASPVVPKLNGLTNGRPPASPTVAESTQVVQLPAQPSQQALRSKGPPPPPPKPDISAIVFEFSGGNGDRYLFPKFSILESVPLSAGQQVIASFLIVRKGSASEYPAADPALDYYQPATIRLYAHSGRYLENLARVVAREEDVRRYMDDVMEKMTRAEYVLLAMRLPRGPSAQDETKALGEKEAEKDKEREAEKQSSATGPAPIRTEIKFVHKAPQPTVLWTTKPPKPEIRELPPRSRMYNKLADADEQYQSFITAVSRKEAEEV